MKDKTTKRRGVAAKLIPATCMLLVSATALVSSTYAWFTMSREVEVQNIQMTATTPEDIQISIGQIGSNATTASTTESYTLAGNTGVLVNTSGVVTAPREEGTANDELDWSNIADISAYYAFGKLIPASSTDGEDVYYTPDASGVGRTFKAGANFYQAADGATANKAGTNSTTGITADTSAKATSHIYSSTEKTSASSHTWGARSSENTTGYLTATTYGQTNDDGYYIDIPVWLRTSSTAETKVYVSGYVTSQLTPENPDADTDDLYKAVRVAILSTSGEGGTTYAADKGCLTLADGLDKYIDPVTGQAVHAGKFPTWTGFANILDSDNYNATGTSNKSGISGLIGRANGQTGVDGSKIYALNATTATTLNNVAEGTHGEIVQNDAATANNVATLNVGTGVGYGNSTKLIIRVWLEGEDGNCWNENAGQNWNIALKFSKDPLPTTNPSGG